MKLKHIAIATLIACGLTLTGTAGAQDRVKVEFWTMSLKPKFTSYFQDLVKKYEADNPNRFVAGFLGSPPMNLVPATVSAVSEGQVQLKLADGASLVLAGTATGVCAGDAATLGFRPEQAGLLPAHGYYGAALTGPVELIEHLGGATLVHVRCAGTAQPLIVSLPSDVQAPSVGEHVTLTPDMQRVHLFDGDGNPSIVLPRPAPVVEEDSPSDVPAQPSLSFEDGSST